MGGEHRDHSHCRGTFQEAWGGGGGTRGSTVSLGLGPLLGAGGSPGGAGRRGQEAGSPHHMGLQAAEGLCGHLLCTRVQPGRWVGWGPVLSSAVSYLSRVSVTRPQGGLCWPSKRKTSRGGRDGGQMGFRSISAALGGWASPELPGGGLGCVISTGVGGVLWGQSGAHRGPRGPSRPPQSFPGGLGLL